MNQFPDSVGETAVDATLAPEEAIVRDEYPVPPGPTVREPPSHGEFNRLLPLIAMGLFITTIGQPNVIGRLPFMHLFKTDMKMGATAIAGFWAVSSFAWYIKPVAGLLCDSFPLFGTRRKWYLVIASALAGFCWMLYALLPHQYKPFLYASVVLSVMMVFVSTVSGGLMVEMGQKYGANGRLASMRQGLEGIIALIVGPLGGWLASRAFGITVGIGAALLFSLVPAGLFLLREPRTAKRNTQVWADALAQLQNVLASPTMWYAAILLFLVYAAPGFSTPLYFYQTDTLKFSQQFIGNLGMIGGIGGLLGASFYAFYCRKISLRVLLTFGIGFNIISTLFYLGYRSAGAAEIIEFGNGVFGTIAVLPLFDLASRATPKGSESFGFSLMMSVRNVTLIAFSDVLGSYLFDKQHWPFLRLVWLNAGTTAIAFLAIPFLPAALMRLKEGETAAA